MKPHLQTTIWTLLRNNATQREIARVTGISRHTIRAYQKRFAAEGGALGSDAVSDASAQTAPPWPPARSPVAAAASLLSTCEPLRHRSPQTTAIYARIDLDALRPLALPWPGGAQ